MRKHYSRRKARVVGLNKIAKHGNSGREIYEYACREDIPKEGDGGRIEQDR